MRRRRLMAAAASALVTAATGCGGDGGSDFPPAAEPAVSPPLVRRPAGGSFAVGSQPEGLVVDARTQIAGAITRNPSALTLADLERERVVGATPLPATGRHLTLEHPGGPVLVPVEQTDDLVEVELPSGAARTIAVGDHPHDVATAAGRVFVGDEFGDAVTVLDGKGRTRAELAAPEQPGGLAATDGQLAVVAVAERVLAVYDARTLQLVAELPAGDGPTHVVAGGRRAWVADTDGGAILGYRLGPRPELVSRTPLSGSPYGLALDARRERLWVTLTARNRLVLLDLSGERPAARGRYPTLRQPNSVAVDPRTGAAVVAGRAAGRLEVIGDPR